MYPQDFVDFFIRNNFQFLDDVFHKWLDNFYIEPFYSMINNLDSHLKLIFENPFKSLNFFDITIWIFENNLVFGIHYKATNLFNYLTCTSCYPPHTKNNILLSLHKHTHTHTHTHTPDYHSNMWNLKLWNWMQYFYVLCKYIYRRICICTHQNGKEIKCKGSGTRVSCKHALQSTILHNKLTLYIQRNCISFKQSF